MIINAPPTSTRSAGSLEERAVLEPHPPPPPPQLRQQSRHYIHQWTQLWTPPRDQRLIPLQDLQRVPHLSRLSIPLQRQPLIHRECPLSIRLLFPLLIPVLIQQQRRPQVPA